MKKEIIVIGILALLLLSSFAVGLGSSNANGNTMKISDGGVKGYTTHGVIRINSDADFDSSHGVVGGSGTSDDPYIISRWDIDAHGAGNAIYVGNTTAYFVVENCYLHNASRHSWPYFDGDGITLYKVKNGKISGNNITNNDWDGIYIDSSSNNTISKNNITNNGDSGIYLSSSSYPSSSNNIISRNNITNNWEGIHLDITSGNTISGNIMIEDSIVLDGNKDTFTTQTIYTNNTVNGKPVYYYKNVNMNNASVPLDAGEVICGNVTWLKIESLNLSNGTVGIELGYSSNITISGNNIMNHDEQGIYLESSSSNIISGNNITNNYWDGIYLDFSSNNTISSNNITKNEEAGIGLHLSSNNTISSNNITKNYDGILLGYSSSNTIYDNLISNNGYYGIFIDSGSYNLIYNNSFYYNHGSGDTYDSSHVQAKDDGTNNSWNTSGTPHGYGNYWQDWANNNNTNDKNNDGIVDWPYKIDAPSGAKDEYPLRCPIIKSAPSAPYNLAANSGDGYVNLTWDKPICNGSSPITQYNIYRNGVLIKIKTVSSNQLWFNDTTVQNGQTYTYYVTAVNSVGESKKSNEVQATPSGAVPEFSTGIWLFIIMLIALLGVIRFSRFS